MNKDCIRFLYEILDGVSAEKDSSLKNVIYNTLYIYNKRGEFSINDLYQRSWDENLSEQQLKDWGAKDTAVKDYRICQLKFYNFRSFPNYDNEVPYGIRFCELADNSFSKPCSLFLVGENGVGKSSLFTALEFLFTGKSSLEETAGVEDNYKKYGFNRVPVNVSKVLGVLANKKTLSRDVNNVNETESLSNSSAFCSEYDVEQLENKNHKLVEYFFEQLGYGDILDIHLRLISLKKGFERELQTMRLSDVIMSPDDVNSVMYAFFQLIQNSNKKSKEEILDQISNFLDAKKIDKIARSNDELPEMFRSNWETLRELTSLEKEYSNDPMQMAFQRAQSEKSPQERIKQDLSNMYGALRDAYDFFIKRDNIDDATNYLFDIRRIAMRFSGLSPLDLKKNLEKQMNEISGFIALIEEKGMKMLDDFTNSAKEFIENALKQFSVSNNSILEEFEFTYDKTQRVDSRFGSLDLIIHVKSQNQFDANPHEYLNSFRFKLFCLAFKISLVFWYMKDKNVFVPIVIDDMFSASDFGNNLKIERFVYQMFKTYSRIFEGSVFKVPLQLIMLTHDDIICSSFKKGLNMQTEEDLMKKISNGVDYSPIEYNLISGRIMHFSEAHKIPENCSQNDKNSIINLYFEFGNSSVMK